MGPPLNLLRLWFGFDLPVNRRAYIWTGVGLMAFKYGVDAAMLWRYAGRWWTPLDYFNPMWQVRERLMQSGPNWLVPMLVLFALPFLWIGVSMSARRALDAGMSAWWALLFFLPVVNIGLMAVLSGKPSMPRRESREVDSRLESAMVGVALVVGDTLLSMLVAIYFRGQYSTGLFLGLPFMLGFMTGNVYARRVPQSAGTAVGLALAAVTVAAGTVILFALEGIVCILMALPLAWAIAVPGALLGRAVALRPWWRRSWTGTAALFVPVLVAVQPGATPEDRLVVSAVEIAAPTDVVWEHVVTFPEMPPATGWMFRVGMAAPLAARIDGSGVGAVRYCEFTTGSFTEPITAWEEGRLLGFDITAQPAALREWSPWGTIEPPHLDGYFAATRGEFRLAPLPGGRTRLVGTTAYRVRMGPEWYWAMIAGRVVEVIHLQVLQHIRRLAEAHQDEPGGARELQ